MHSSLSRQGPCFPFKFSTPPGVFIMKNRTNRLHHISRLDVHWKSKRWSPWYEWRHRYLWRHRTWYCQKYFNDRIQMNYFRLNDNCRQKPSLTLKPFGNRVLSFQIHRVSAKRRDSSQSDDSRKWTVIQSTRETWWLLKCSYKRKPSSMLRQLKLRIRLRWLLNRVRNLVTVDPTYWRLQSLHVRT